MAYVIEGPLLPEEERQAVRELASALPNVVLVPFDADYAAVVRAADVVVSMGGYNSVVEAVSFGKRPVVVPRLPGALEQKLRADYEAEMNELRRTAQTLRTELEAAHAEGAAAVAREQAAAVAERQNLQNQIQAMRA